MGSKRQKNVPERAIFQNVTGNLKTSITDNVRASEGKSLFESASDYNWAQDDRSPWKIIEVDWWYKAWYDIDWMVEKIILFTIMQSLIYT